MLERIRQMHQQRGRFVMRRAVDDQRRHHTVWIQSQIFRLLLRTCSGIDEGQRMRRIQFDQHPVNDKAGRSRRIVKRVVRGIHGGSGIET